MNILYSAYFAALLILLGFILGVMLPACSTYRGFQQDVHGVTNPNWRR